MKRSVWVVLARASDETHTHTHTFLGRYFFYAIFELHILGTTLADEGHKHFLLTLPYWKHVLIYHKQ